MLLAVLAAFGLRITEAPTDDQLRAAARQAPGDVAGFIARRADCNYFAGEEPYDKQRAAELDRALKRLRCDRLDGEDAALRSKYQARPEVLRLIERTTDLLGR